MDELKRIKTLGHMRDGLIYHLRRDKVVRGYANRGVMERRVDDIDAELEALLGGAAGMKGVTNG